MCIRNITGSDGGNQKGNVHLNECKYKTIRCKHFAIVTEINSLELLGADCTLQVLHDSAAQRQGMQVLDRIVSVNGLDVNNMKVHLST